MDAWLVYHQRKHQQSMHALKSALSPNESENVQLWSNTPRFNEVPNHVSHAVKKRAEQARLELEETKRLCTLYRESIDSKPSPLRLGVLLLRAHRALSERMVSHDQLDKIIVLLGRPHSDLAEHIRKEKHSLERNKALEQQWVKEMRERLEYQTLVFQDELSAFAKHVSANVNTLFPYFSAGSKNGLKPWKEIYPILTSDSETSRNHPRLMERAQELEYVTAICKNLPL